MKQDLMRNRKLFASLVNNISKAGERKIKAEELIPEASEGSHSNLGTIGFAIGFTLMMMLDVVLG